MTAGALLTAALALPATAADSGTAAPYDAVPGATASPSGAASPGPTDTPTATATGTPTGTGTGTPTGTVGDTPTDPPGPTDPPTDAPTPTPTDTASPEPSGSGTPDPAETTPPPHRFQVYRVGNSWSDHWKLSVSVYSDTSAVAGITAHYRPHGAPADAPDAGTTSAFVTSPYLYNDRTAAQRIALPAMGVYDISVDITDSRGEVEHFPDAGQFTYAAQVSVGKLSADRGSVDYEHRSYAVSAPVTVTDPSTGAALDPAGVSVDLTNPDLGGGVDTVAVATARADGRVSAPVTVKGDVTYRTAGADGTATAGYPYFLDGSDQTPLTVRAKAETTRIRVLSKTDVNVPRGGRTTITGVYERKAGSAWVGTPGQKIYTQGPAYFDATARTRADGTFTVTTGTAGSYYFCNYWNYDPFLLPTDNSTTPVHVHIPTPSRVTPFRVSEDEYGEAVIDGHLDLYGSEFANNTHSMTIQYSSNGKSWHTVGTTRIGRQGLPGDEFMTYATYGGQANGYWRAYFPGTPDFSPSYSAAVKIYRTPTRVTGGKPSRTTVRKNTYVTFGGHLQQRSTSGKWSGISRSYAYLEFRPAGSKTWHYVTRVKTDSKGAYHLRGKSTRSGTWVVVWFTSDSRHIDSNGPETYVRVK
ncbi:hypothetical protein ACFZAM_00490 [Streptomyces sp. NPDC008079]|uniref:hypothetical protein n=1 Tax=Streptomyces sp. NPDC008079 TaxID=3364806 RepID=UPI0036E01D89